MLQSVAVHKADDGGKVYPTPSVTAQRVIIDSEVDRLRRASRQATAATPRWGQHEDVGHAPPCLTPIRSPKMAQRVC